MHVPLPIANNYCLQAIELFALTHIAIHIGYRHCLHFKTHTSSFTWVSLVSNPSISCDKVSNRACRAEIDFSSLSSRPELKKIERSFKHNKNRRSCRYIMKSAASTYFEANHETQTPADKNSAYSSSMWFSLAELETRKNIPDCEFSLLSDTNLTSMLFSADRARLRKAWKAFFITRWVHAGSNSSHPSPFWNSR